MRTDYRVHLAISEIWFITAVQASVNDGLELEMSSLKKKKKRKAFGFEMVISLFCNENSTCLILCD